MVIAKNATTTIDYCCNFNKEQIMDIIQIDNIEADILPFDFNKLNMNPCLDMDRQEEQCDTHKTIKDEVIKRQHKSSNK